MVCTKLLLRRLEQKNEDSPLITDLFAGGRGLRATDLRAKNGELVHYMLFKPFIVVPLKTLAVILVRTTNIAFEPSSLICGNHKRTLTTFKKNI